MWFMLACPTSCRGGRNRLTFSLFWVHAEGAGTMGEVHSHQFRPVGQTWLWGEENELCCECGERLWVIFEDSHSPRTTRRGLRSRFHERFDHFGRVDTA